MITVNEATRTILSYKLELKSETIALEDSLSRTLAEVVLADINQPPFHRVAMDGIAINRKELESKAKFKNLGCISAGSKISCLPPGKVCYEVMTGAVLPDNADMVIRYEDLLLSETHAELKADPEKLSSNFHPMASDYKMGDEVLQKGTVIKSTTAAILASVGKAQVSVYRSPRVAILCTGDELVDVDQKPEAHQIRWSNGASLRHELLAWGFHQVSLKKVVDNEALMKEAMENLISAHDVLILTGGVSAGKYDFVPKLLKQCGIEEVFHKVAQKPGKPLWFGKKENQVFVFGLPGNPVSCLINLRKYVIPFLENSIPGRGPKQAYALLSEKLNLKQAFTFYCPVKVKNIEGKVMAFPLKGNGSGDFFCLRDSDGFVQIENANDTVTELFLWGKHDG